MEIRSFLAFELPPEIRRIICDLSGELKKSSLDVRWVTATNIHLTLVFMGKVHMEDLEPINETVANVCRRYRPFNLSLKGAGVFGGRRNPRVLWVGVDGDIKRMSYFRDALQKRLRPFGIKEEKRKYKPHLTFGRFRKNTALNVRLEELLLTYRTLTSPVGTIGELSLYKSDLRPGGAVYTRINAWPLKGNL